MSLITHLKERKLFQWALAYLAGAWVVVEASGLVVDQFHLPEVLGQGITVGAFFGFFVALVLAWYHGEKGRQRVGGMELVILASVLVVAGLGISRLKRPAAAPLERTADTSLVGSGPLSISALAGPAVAVLPFANMAGPEHQDFTDGMHEEVLHAVGQLSGLIVKSPESVQQYRVADLSTTKIAEELDADAVLEGNVRAAGDRVRVTVQLIDPRTDAHLWSRTFDEVLEVERLFAIQEEVAREIALALRVTLTPQEDAWLSSRPTESLDARTVLLQARAAPLRSAERERLIHLAIEMDSTYDRAWGLLALLLARRALRTSDEGLADSALALAQRAIAMNPSSSSAEPYTAIGYVSYRRGRVGEAREAFEEQLRRDPNSGNASNSIGVTFESEGRYPEAVAAYRRQIRVAPRSTLARVNLAELYAVMGLNEEADRLLAEVGVLNPEQGVGYVHAYQGDPAAALNDFERSLATRTRTAQGFLRAGAHMATFARNLERARELALQAHELDPDALPIEDSGHTSRVTLGYLALLDGDSAAAGVLLADAYARIEPLVREGWELWALPRELATIEAIRGNSEAANAWLQKTHDLGFRAYQEIELEPMFDSLRDDPEFQRILTRLRDDVAEMRGRVLQQDAALEASLAARR